MNGTLSININIRSNPNTSTSTKPNILALNGADTGWILVKKIKINIAGEILITTGAGKNPPMALDGPYVFSLKFELNGSLEAIKSCHILSRTIQILYGLISQQNEFFRIKSFPYFELKYFQIKCISEQKTPLLWSAELEFMLL